MQKHLGSDSLARWIQQSGWPTTRHASRAGYRVLHVSAPAEGGPRVTPTDDDAPEGPS